MKESQMNRLFIAFLYVLAFVLLQEWLVLITEVTATGYLSLFLIFAGVGFLLSLVNVKWPISILVKGLYILWAVQTIYMESAWFSFQQIMSIIHVVIVDVGMIFTGKMIEISNVSRTILLFLLIWMLVYLIRYWIEVRQRIFLFYFTTIILVATADTFTAYSAEGSIFLLMIVGLLLLGLLTIARLNEKYRSSFSIRQLLVVMLPLVFLIVISSFFMSFSPKLAPVWADPLPFFKSIVEEKTGENPTVSKSGYDSNDSHLGGPFVEDNSLVFEAIVDEKQYWRVETKDTYTSKGWEQSEAETRSKKMSLGEMMVNEEASMDNLKSAQLSLAEEFLFIIHPYGIRMIDSVDDAEIYYDELTDKYITKKNGKPFPMSAYHITFNEKMFSLQKLTEATAEDLELTKELERYIQLPDTLPERVSSLAESITASSDSVYEKAKAIEQHFKQNDFTYERADVAIPTGDEDYVDQFLFDTKKGYCDNFSSSMVVMLRAVGIPARWVKGFAPGELTHSDEEEKVYRVSNNEAHSWVEAYIPNLGWMPFEPTIGFEGVAHIEDDFEPSIDDSEDDQKSEDEKAASDPEQTEQEEEKGTDSAKSNQFNLMDKMSVLSFLFIGFLISMGILVYRTRRKWLPVFIIRRYQVAEGSWETFSRQYKQLVKQLARNGLKRAPNETWSTYAKRVDAHFGGRYMQKLTKVYEQGIYGEMKEAHDWQQLEEIWKDSIKRTSD